MQMQKKKFIHFDTINSTYKTDSYNTTFNLFMPLHRVSRIYLKSIEMPIGFSNIRSAYCNVSYILTKSNITTSYSFAMIEKIYTSIATFLTDLNLAFSNSITQYLSTGESAPVFSISTIYTNKIIMTQTLITTLMTLQPKTLLSYYLGYNYSLDKVVKTNNIAVTSFSNVYSLNFDNYLNMTIANLPLKTTNNNMQNCTYKIPLNSLLYFRKFEFYTGYFSR